MIKNIFTLSMSVVLFTASSVSANDCLKSTLFGKNSYDLDSSTSQFLEESYHPSSKLCSPLTHQQIQEVSELREALKAKFFNQKEDKKTSVIFFEVHAIIESFIAMQLLAKNAYMNALEKELNYFTEKMFALNARLNTIRHLTDDQKNEVLNLMFSHLSEINSRVFKSLSGIEKQRVLQFLNLLSASVLKDDYSNEYKKIIKKYENEDGLHIGIGVAIMGVLTLTVTLSGISYFDFSAFQNAVNTAIGAYPISWSSFKLARYLRRPWHPIDKNPARIHNAASKACFIYLDESLRK